jgi:hypothetical protein
VSPLGGADPEHDGRHHFLSWVGGAFDPTGFDLAWVNTRLQRVRSSGGLAAGEQQLGAAGIERTRTSTKRRALPGNIQLVLLRRFSQQD